MDPRSARRRQALPGAAEERERAPGRAGGREAPRHDALVGGGQGAGGGPGCCSRSPRVGHRRGAMTPRTLFAKVWESHIVHRLPEGPVIVCGDSHTSTHGAFGALGFGIGTSEVEHVLATQCLVMSQPRTFEAHFRGRLAPGVTPKDLILGFIGRIGTAGATGHVIEYTGDVIRGFSMEERMTVCKMSIEAGA